MPINYKLKPFQILVGAENFDATDYVDGFEIGTNEMAIGAPLTWNGSIDFYRNRQAEQTLPATAFDLYANPQRWRPDRVVKLKLTATTGETATIPLRIQRYGYQNKAGKASVWQLSDILSRDRPGMDAGFSVGASGTPLPDAIKALIKLAFTDTGMTPTPILADSIWGGIDDMISTRSPINDAIDLASTCWQWMTMGANESFGFISGDPLTYPLLFARAEGDFELEPDIESQNNWMSKSIVTGSYQQAFPPKEDCDDDRELDSLDEQGRPGAIRTTLEATFAEVFPDQSFAGVNILGSPVSSYDQVILQEEKVVLYRYGDDGSVTVGSSRYDSMAGAIFDVVFGTGVPNIVSIANALPIIPVDLENAEPVLTVTISIRFAGAIYPTLGPVVQRRVASIEVQSERVKQNYKPRGTVRPAYGADWKLVESPKETIEEQSASRPAVQPGRNKNAPPDQPPRCLEKRVKPEPRQTAPQWEMRTIPVKAECDITPLGWEPLIKLPLITDFGFLPSQAHGDYLACQIAAAEVRKLDQGNATMPIADEWIRAGMPPTFRCHLHDAHYHATAVRILYSRNPNTAKLLFRASRIGSAPVVSPMIASIPPLPFEFDGVNPSASTDTSLRLSLSVAAIDGIAGNPLGPFQVTAAGGGSLMPYTFSLAAPTLAWASINPTTGTLTLDESAQPTAGFSGVIRIRVSDGTNEAFHDVPHNLQPAYAVTPDYREQATIEWFVPLSSNAEVFGVSLPIIGDWRIPLSSSTEVIGDTDPVIHASTVPLSSNTEVAPNEGGSSGGGS